MEAQTPAVSQRSEAGQGILCAKDCDNGNAQLLLQGDIRKERKNKDKKSGGDKFSVFKVTRTFSKILRHSISMVSSCNKVNVTETI